MLRNSNKSGFTIIEVVITIAIGAAVMALVLNAVAGARRSQRNNARSADINQVAAAVNQYIAARNSLPTQWGQLANIVECASATSCDFGHYAFGSINPVSTATAGEEKGPVNSTARNIEPAVSGTINGSDGLGVDEFVIIRQANCTDSTAYGAGGIREMAIMYKLEGQNDPSCLEV